MSYEKCKHGTEYPGRYGCRDCDIEQMNRDHAPHESGGKGRYCYKCGYPAEIHAKTAPEPPAPKVGSPDTADILIDIRRQIKLMRARALSIDDAEYNYLVPRFDAILAILDAKKAGGEVTPKPREWTIHQHRGETAIVHGPTIEEGELVYVREISDAPKPSEAELDAAEEIYMAETVKSGTYRHRAALEAVIRGFLRSQVEVLNGEAPEPTNLDLYREENKPQTKGGEPQEGSGA